MARKPRHKGQPRRSVTWLLCTLLALYAFFITLHHTARTLFPAVPVSHFPPKIHEVGLLTVKSRVYPNPAFLGDERASDAGEEQEERSDTAAPGVEETFTCTTKEDFRVFVPELLKTLWGQSEGRECCEACKKLQDQHDSAKSCNAWSYCRDRERCKGEYGKCELRHVSWPQVMDHDFVKDYQTIGVWTSGYLEQPRQHPIAARGGDRKYHVIVTGQGQYVNWQMRIAYYWYKKIKAQCEATPPCDMGGFTRILHSGKADDLMREIPTFVAQPLPNDHLAVQKGYVVLNRPYAVYQWMSSATVPEKYVFMAEPDHLFMKPMPNVMDGEVPVGFGFVYIEPQKEGVIDLVKKFIGNVGIGEADKVPPIGNSPTLMSVEDFRRVVPEWYRTANDVFMDKQARDTWQWVLEMYAFAIACYRQKLWPFHTYKNMMAQPPYAPWICHANEDCPYYVLHYTYTMTDGPEGEIGDPKTSGWHFDKREFQNKTPRRNLTLPPEYVTNKLIGRLIEMLNEAMDNIEGWDEYAAQASVIDLD